MKLVYLVINIKYNFDKNVAVSLCILYKLFIKLFILYGTFLFDKFYSKQNVQFINDIFKYLLF